MDLELEDSLESTSALYLRTAFLHPWSYYTHNTPLVGDAYYVEDVWMMAY